MKAGLAIWGKGYRINLATLFVTISVVLLGAFIIGRKSVCS